MKNTKLLSTLLVILGGLLAAVSFYTFSIGVKLGDQLIKYLFVGIGALGMAAVVYGLFLLRKGL